MRKDNAGPLFTAGLIIAAFRGSIPIVNPGERRCSAWP